MRRFIIVVPFCVLFLAVPACTKNDGGGNPSVQKTGKGPCFEDRKKFCDSVQPGGGRIIKCLDEHFDDLSPNCQQMQEKRRVRMQKKAKRAGVGPSETKAAKKTSRSDKKK